MIQASGGVCSCSDLRYKKDITSLTTSLNQVTQQQGVNYYWKTEAYPQQNFSEDLQIGLIAQEVEKIYPELVHTDSEGYKTVDYSKLTPILVEAVKELKAQNDQLKARADTKDAEMEQLNERLQNLEAAINTITAEETSEKK